MEDQAKAWPSNLIWWFALALKFWDVYSIEIGLEHSDLMGIIHPVNILVITSRLYYKPMTIINEDSRVINKPKTLITDEAGVVIYDRHMFIVQATDISGLFYKVKFDCIF